MNKKFLTTVLVLAIAGALVSVYFTTLRGSRIDLRPYKFLGEAAADETAKLLNNSGNIVLVGANFDRYKLLTPTGAAQIQAFERAISKTSLKIVAIEKVNIAQPSLGRVGVFMESGQIADLIERHSDADAIVLFVGLAGMGDLQGTSSQSKKPNLILVSNTESTYKILLQTHAIQMAIVPRPDADDDQDKSSDTCKQWFERHYSVVTPDQVSNLRNVPRPIISGP